MSLFPQLVPGPSGPAISCFFRAMHPTLCPSSVSCTSPNHGTPQLSPPNPCGPQTPCPLSSPALSHLHLPTTPLNPSLSLPDGTFLYNEQVSISLVSSNDFRATPVEKEEESYCLCVNGRKTVSWAVTPKSLGKGPGNFKISGSGTNGWVQNLCERDQMAPKFLDKISGISNLSGRD